MLSHVTAVRFDGRVQSGRTAPCRLTCEAADGTDVEVVAKFSDGCDRKVTALAGGDKGVRNIFLSELGPWMGRMRLGMVPDTVPAPSLCASCNFWKSDLAISDVG